MFLLETWVTLFMDRRFVGCFGNRFIEVVLGAGKIICGNDKSFHF